MALRLIKKQPVRLPLGEDDWLEVWPDISKRQFGQLIAALPDDFAETQSMSPTQTEQFTTSIFETFVTDWSVVDDEGNPVPATVDNYLELTRESATAVDAALMEHFNGQSPSEDELTKSKEPRGKRS
jgi:hypothetical protein